MDIMIIGASRGLGRALGEGLCKPGDTLTGVSRTRPAHLTAARGTTVHWIEADLSQPQAAAARIDAQAPPVLDVLVCNLGIWEAQAFSDAYDFLASPDEELARLVDTNLTALLLLLRRLLPRLLRSRQPRLVLTGSTSALRRSGRPEVAFGATKAALDGIADALREQFRAQRLAVTTLHLGYLNTDDGLQVPREVAAARGAGTRVPVHDVVAVLRSLLSLSDASFVRELVMPAIADPHF
ncbi:SDR family oxidoreductase [Stenotrophomonas sp. 24(2023)]|uniref:SDR family NAD(P)-dependent oxidoreductase n=1 Tax=Stenotrophomonas sp. 24(2023) TaxID=3068324 RepID=UPI0027E1658D|nr:SDR family oxidoreductase [Stenotrophomonas sp. 24(2023)]WMJ71230.1 SDR family oxidoreductase [Stenotrophomonas sp. 24(2023)]